MDDQDRVRERCLRWEEAWDCGEELTAAALCADTPELLTEVARQIEELREVKRWLAGDNAAVTPATRSFLGAFPPLPDDLPVTRPTPISTLPPDDSAIASAQAPQSPAGVPLIPGYQILGELGKGGMGVVYKARQIALKRIVALKMMLSGRGAAELARFRSEAEVLARLQHPNIVQIYEIGEYTGQPYFSLEFIEGGSLDKAIAGKPQGPREAAELLVTLARAMHAAHQQGIIHRDLKPANVLLASGGRESPGSEGTGDSRPPLATPKITDFGLAKQLDDDSGQTKTGMIFGTPNYMAPEQANGQLDLMGPVTDVYALGAILYELLTGRPPFVGRTVWATLDQVRHNEPVSPRQLQPTCPRDLETICLAALHKSPAGRYASAQELADDIQRYLDGRPIVKRPVGRVVRLAKWVKRSPLQAGLAAAGIALAILVPLALAAQVQLARTEQEKSQQELTQQRILAEANAQIQAQYSLALEKQQRGDVAACAEAARTGLRMIDDQPALQPHSLRPLFEDLRLTSERELAERQGKSEEEQRVARLRQHYSDAGFFAAPFTGLELPDSVAQVEKAAREGLALFDVALDGQGPPRPGRRFTREENRVVAELCCELLVLYADALTLVQVGENEAAVEERWRRAVRLLDRADTLGVGQTRASLSCRAVCLARLGDKEAADRVRDQVRGTPYLLAGDYFLEGLQSYRDQKLAAAVEMLSRTLKKDRDNYAAEYLRTLCRVREKSYGVAREGLTRCLTLRPDVVWPRLLLGVVETEEGKYEEALKVYEAVFAGQPDEMTRYVAHVNRGALRVKQRQWAAATSDFEAAIALRPEVHVAYLNLAVLHRERVELGGLESFLHLGAADGLTAAGLALWKREAWQSAVAALDRIIARRVRVPGLYQERARLHLKLGDTATARADLSLAIANAPTLSDPLVNDVFELGRLLCDGSEFPQAIVALDAVLQLRPRHAAAWYVKSQALYGLHRYREAGTALSQYLELAPERAQPRTPELTVRLREAYRARAVIHIKLSQYREAADCYTRGLELGRTAALLSERGRAYLALGAPALARADFEELLRDRGDDGEALLGLAGARVELGDWKKAVEAAEAGLSKTQGETSRYVAARVYAQAYLRAQAERAGTVERLAARAVELLRQALPGGLRERQAYWRDKVEKDVVMKALSGEPAMRRLSAEVLYAGE